MKRGLVYEMRRQPLNRVCGELGAVVHPDIRQSTPGFRDQFLQHHAGVVGDLLVGSRHEAGRVVSLSAYDCQARAGALDALVHSSRERIRIRRCVCPFGNSHLWRSRRRTWFRAPQG